MITPLERLIHERWSDWIGGPCPDSLSVVQRGGTLWEDSRVLFVALDASGAPVLFARAMRNPSRDASLVEEAELLAELDADPRFEGCVPAPVWCGELGGQRVAIERSVAYAPLVGPRPGLGTGLGLAPRFPGDFALATELLARLAEVTREPLPASEFRERVLGPLRDLHVESGASPDSFDRSADALVEAMSDRVCRVVAHGDATPKNFLANGSRCVLIDWETATRDGLPLVDLFYFASRYAWLGAFRHRGARKARVAEFWAKDTAARRSVFDSASEMSRRIRLPETAIPHLFRFHFLHKAWLKRRMRGIDGKLTRVWLDLYRRHTDA
jgi:hypothetical protein